MFDHTCFWCKSPWLSCPSLDDRGCCSRHPRKLIDGRWVYAPGLITPRETPDIEEAA